MALTTAQQVRLRIQDAWRYGSEDQMGDGTASAFKLAQGAPYSTIVSATANIAVPAGWSATGCTFDTALGVAQYSARPILNQPIRYTYQWAVFSDDEIGYFTAAGGSVAGAALQAVRALRFNAPKRARWAAPDGTQFDDSQANQALKELEADILAEVIRNDEGPQGNYVSWAEEQENW